MTGRMMNEVLGKISFWIMFVGFNFGFFPMHNLGLMGMPRRIATYQRGLGFSSLNLLVTLGAFVLGIGILISIINLLVSLRSGRIAGRNPWNSDGLEWETESPPKPYATVHIPMVVSRHPLWDDFEEEADPDNLRVLDQGRMTPTSTWLDGEPIGIATIPSDTLAPLLLALVMFFFFLALVIQWIWVALGALIAIFLISCFWMWPRARAAKEVA
jgi:cytochrome c oxidase subunit 1/cytochrome c oxidase subunit I+III